MELLGYVSFPRITREPYSLTLAPYSFLWLELQTAGHTAEESTPELAAETAGSSITEGAAVLPTFFSWDEFLTGAGAAMLDPALRNWLPRSCMRTARRIGFRVFFDEDLDLAFPDDPFAR